MIEDLRNEDDEDLIIQCNVFDDEKQEDDEDLALLNPAGVDISNPQEVFNALYQKVCNISLYSVMYLMTKYKRMRKTWLILILQVSTSASTRGVQCFISEGM